MEEVKELRKLYQEVLLDNELLAKDNKILLEQNEKLENELAELQEKYIELECDYGEMYEMQNGWIPCSERLPKCKEDDTESDLVLITYVSNVNKKPHCNTLGVYDYENKCWRDEMYDKIYVEVTAWQPLPAPYEG